MNDVTRILSAIEQGDPQAAEQLLPLVYDELRKLAAQRLAQEKPGQTLQATALVHEAYLRLVGRRRGPALEQPRPLLRRRRRGHAPHPRRERPPQGRPRSTAAAASGSTSTTSTGRRRARREDLLALDEALAALGRRGPAEGRAGQAPLLRRPDRRARRRAALGISPQPPTATGPYARAWLSPRPCRRAATRPTIPGPKIRRDLIGRRWRIGASVDVETCGRRSRPRTGRMRARSELDEEAIFLAAAGAIRRPEARGAYLDRACGRSRRCGDGSRACSRPTSRPAASSTGRPRRRGSPEVAAGPPPMASRRASASAPWSPAATSCSSRSARAAWARSSWPSRRSRSAARSPLKLIKPGMDSSGRPGPVRGRAAGPGADGPPEHRQGARRRHDRRRPAVLRHGAGQGRPDHRVLRRRPAEHPPSGWSCSSRSARRCSTPTRRGSSTATSSRRTSWSRSYDGMPVPKVIDFGVAKATRPAADRADAVHRARRSGRHAAVHEPGAGRARAAWTSTPGATSTPSACSSTSC